MAPGDRVEEDGSQWIATSHNGYGQSFALTHSRQLFLAADGDDLRGEDSLTGPAGEGFAIRFHLHPTVQVSLIQDGTAALFNGSKKRPLAKCPMARRSSSSPCAMPKA